MSLWSPFAHSACIPSGDQNRINRALEQGGAGAKAVLCPRAEFRLTGTVRFTANNQEIYTEGLPTDDTRARLVITGRNLTGAVDGLHKSGVKLRNVIIDGGRSRLGYRSGEGTEDREALITIGGTASGQVVEYVKAFDTRSWSILQIAEGDTAEGSAEACTGAQIRHNALGPAGEANGTWADGISLGCRNSTVSDNVITDTTDGAIVIFGAPGSLITRNHIRAVSRTGLIGIAMADYNPYHGNYTGTRVTDNTIEAVSAPIRVAMPMGPWTWFCARDSSHWPSPDWTGWPNRGGVVTNNILLGDYMGYGFAVDGVENWTVTGNVDRAKHVGTPGRPGCEADELPAAPRGFQKHGRHAQGTFQREFEEAYLEPANGLTD
ncbi:MAG: right-handed parallel beta-helix repeat-containing protein [Elusimicrobia bacterium]|nr:right-handed parallel beta-helix repeat-containing protein [Elusimicrobiota bacterium]